MSARLRFIGKQVLEVGCSQCRDLLAYTVVHGDREIGVVRMVRLMAGHPQGPHFGVDWEAVAPDGTLLSGRYGRYVDTVGTTFVSRAVAAGVLVRHAPPPE